MSRLSACLLSLVVTAAAAAEPTLERTLVGRPFAAEYRVDDLALSGDGEVVLGAVGGRVAVWEASSGRRLGELPAGEHVDALATAGALLITAQDAAARVRVYDAARRERLAELCLEPGYEPVYALGSGMPPSPVVALAVSPDATRLAVAWKREVRVLRLPELELVRWLRAPVEASPLHPDFADVHHLRWTPDGRGLEAWTAQRGYGWSWDLARAPVAVALPPPPPDAEWVHAVCSLADGDAIELRSRRAGDGVDYRLVRAGAGGDRWATPVPAADVVFDTSLLALEDRGVVLLAGAASSARFDLDDGRRQAAGGPNGLRGLFAGPRDGALVLWDRRDRLWTWDADRGDEPFRLAAPALGEPATLCDVDPSLRWAAAELRTGEVVLWDLRRGEVVGRWRDGDAANLNGLAVRDGPLGPRCFYNALTGQGRLRVSGGHTLVDYGQGVRLVARGDGGGYGRDPRGTRFHVGPAGRRLLADDATCVVDVQTGVEQPLPNALRFTHTAALARDGRRVAVAGLADRDSVLVVFARDGDVWREVQRAPLTGVAQGLAFSPDGRRLAAVDQLGAVTLDLGSVGAAEQGRIALFGAAAATFLPDGRLALGARDGSVTVWSLGR